MSEVSTQVRVAAAISYRPACNVAEEFAGLPAETGVLLRFYELTSVDGRVGLAAHRVPEKVDPNTPLVISVHGSGGSIASQPGLALAQGVSARGVPVLSINTRQSGAAVNTDNFYATVRDIEAAYWLARDLGYQRIVLHGHSLGSSQVSFFAATHWHDTTAGVVLTGMFADLPWKSRHLLINDEQTYRTLTGEAIEAAQAGEYSRVLATGMPWLRDQRMPVSAEHFLTYRRTGLAGTRSIEWIARIPYPVLLIRDEHDAIIHDFEPGCLEAALADGMSPSVTSVSLSSESGTNGHSFEGSLPALLGTVSGWLNTLADCRVTEHTESSEVGRG